MLEDLSSRNQLLGNKGSNGDHSKTAIVQLLGLHVLAGSRVGGKQVKGVESQIAGFIVVPKAVEVLGLGRSPPKTYSVRLAQANGEQ